MAALNYAARMMRSVMVDQSRINPNNATGVSAGSGGDGFKLAGTRCESMEAFTTDGPLGGRQGGLGKFGPIQYSAGSIYDRVNEAYAGPHDWLSNKLFGFYDKNGNGVSWNFPGGSALQCAVSGSLVVPATVLVIGSVIPESAYGSLTPLRRQ